MDPLSATLLSSHTGSRPLRLGKNHSLPTPSDREKNSNNMLQHVTKYSTTIAAAALLEPSDRAAFAVTSRVLSCIVTESMLRAFYLPMSSEHAVGVCVILSMHVIGECPVIESSIRPADVFAVIPLHHAPICKGVATKHGRPIWMVDPLDMLPMVYELQASDSVDLHNLGSSGADSYGVQNALQVAILSSLVPPSWEINAFTHLRRSLDPLHWWNKFAQSVVISDDARVDVAKQLESSFIWQSKGLIFYISSTVIDVCHDALKSMPTSIHLCVLA